MPHDWKAAARELRRETLELETYISWLQRQLITRRAQRDTARAELAEALAALRPFAYCVGDDDVVRGSYRADDCRRAAAVLTKHESASNGRDEGET